ncbi:MAG: hypothetical protein WDM77_22060 [Steroidobacteraceae bacterium]
MMPTSFTARCDSTPSIVVNGKYRLNVESAGGATQPAAAGEVPHRQGVALSDAARAPLLTADTHAPDGAGPGPGRHAV